MAKKAAKKKKAPVPKKKGTGGRKPDKTWHKAFIASLETHGIVAVACRQCKLNRSIVTLHYKNYPEFKELHDEAIESSTELLEHEALRRARVGWEEPVYQGGKKVGKKLKFSDTLLIFMLKARKPDKYRDNYGEDRGASGPVTIVLQTNPVLDERKH